MIRLGRTEKHGARRTSTASNLTLDEIEEETLKLFAESWAELVESLLASFSGSDFDVQREWLDEAERRRWELVEG